MRLDPNIGREIGELEQAAHRAQFEYRMALSPQGPDLMAEGAAVLGELSAVLEYHYDDGKETVEDEQLEVLESEHATPTSHDAMALALDDYAAMADPIRVELDGLADFSAETIDEARALASRLRLTSAPDAAVTAAEQALRLRNQVWTLLYNRVREVRRTARVVFRNHPEIVRQVTSDYQRRLRAEARRRASKAALGQGETQ